MTVLVLVKTGSKYETAEVSGVSHFLEHLFFKGSKKYPTVRKLTEALDRLGAEYNAFTDKEATGFWVKVAAPNAEQAAAIVGDMLRAPRFPKNEMERERGVILEELNLYFDTPIRFIGDLWEKVLYGDQPAGRYIGGTPETVRAIQHRDVLKHFDTYYRGKSIVVTVAGALPKSRAERVARKYFRSLRDGDTPPHPPVAEAQLKPNVLLHYKKTDQTQLAVGVRGVSLTHPLRHAVMMLAAILGGTMSSRLFLLIRDRLGLAYSIRTVAESDPECGSLVTIAGIKNSRTHLAADVILKEYRKLARAPVPLSELKKAQQAMIGHFVLGLEQTDEIAAYIASQELLLNRVRVPEEEIVAVRKVTPRDVKSAAQLLFRRSRLNLALIGPDSDKKSWYHQLEKAFR